ncbi:TPA: hypothetical protein JBF73_07825 [Legionella pneumophila]|nr:hypothetical protein [Legionella pneumophila]
MNRIKYFEDALIQCEQALRQQPEMIELEWIINQLQYLIDLEKGNISDFSTLKTVKIGWIAVREMDGYENKALIHKLCLISTEVEKMKLEKGIIS